MNPAFIPLLTNYDYETVQKEYCNKLVSILNEKLCNGDSENTTEATSKLLLGTHITEFNEFKFCGLEAHSLDPNAVIQVEKLNCDEGYIRAINEYWRKNPNISDIAPIRETELSDVEKDLFRKLLNQLSTVTDRRTFKNVFREWKLADIVLLLQKCYIIGSKANEMEKREYGINYRKNYLTKYLKEEGDIRSLFGILLESLIFPQPHLVYFPISNLGQVKLVALLWTNTLPTSPSNRDPKNRDSERQLFQKKCEAVEETLRDWEHALEDVEELLFLNNAYNKVKYDNRSIIDAIFESLEFLFRPILSILWDGKQYQRVRGYQFDNDTKFCVYTEIDSNNLLYNIVDDMWKNNFNYEKPAQLSQCDRTFNISERGFKANCFLSLPLDEKHVVGLLLYSPPLANSSEPKLRIFDEIFEIQVLLDTIRMLNTWLKDVADARWKDVVEETSHTNNSYYGALRYLLNLLANAWMRDELLKYFEPNFKSLKASVDSLADMDALLVDIKKEKELEKSEVNLHELITEVLKTIFYSIDQLGLVTEDERKKLIKYVPECINDQSFLSQCAKTLPVTTHKRGVQLICLDLLKNALRYTNTEPKIEVFTNKDFCLEGKKWFAIHFSNNMKMTEGAYKFIMEDTESPGYSKDTMMGIRIVKRVIKNKNFNWKLYVDPKSTEPSWGKTDIMILIPYTEEQK